MGSCLGRSPVIEASPTEEDLNSPVQSEKILELQLRCTQLEAQIARLECVCEDERQEVSRWKTKFWQLRIDDLSNSRGISASAV